MTQDSADMTTLDIADDARRIFAKLAGGGIAILPNDVGYAIMGSTTRAMHAR